MVICNSCSTENTDGAKFCVRCGSSLSSAAASSPAPGAWRDSAPGISSELNEPANPESASAPPPPTANPYAVPPPSSSSSVPPPYAPPTPYNPYGQQQPGGGGGMYAPGAGEPMHPAIPAIVSFFLPGIGLLFVPNKAGLGIGVFVGYVLLNIVLFVLSIVTFGLGVCLFFLVPLVNILAAVHSWDEAAKSSGGRFQPLLFK